MLRFGAPVLAIAVAAAAVAGCGRSAEGDGASTESAISDDRGHDPGDAGGTDGASDAGATDAATGPRGPSTTTFAGDLTAIGLDVTNLPALHDLPSSKKMKVMRTFTKTMGISCGDCHVDDDYSAPTPQ